MKSHLVFWILGALIVAALFAERAWNQYTKQSGQAPAVHAERFNLDTLLNHADEIFNKTRQDSASQEEFMDSVLTELSKMKLTKDQFKRAASKALELQRKLEEGRHDTVIIDTVIYHEHHRDTLIINEVHVPVTVYDTIHQKVVVKDTVQGTGWNKKRKRKRK